MNYKERKVMSIGVVSELTDLSERQIRYYEERKLIQPARTPKGTRLYSFDDIETLVEISKKVGQGMQTYTIKKEMQRLSGEDIRKQLLRGQLNAYFGTKTR